MAIDIGTIASYAFIFMFGMMLGSMLFGSKKEHEPLSGDTLVYSMHEEGDSVYAYDLDENFLTQGASIEDLAEKVQAKYPQYSYYIATKKMEVVDDEEKEPV